MITALLLFWLSIVGIQLIYIFFVYTKTAFYRHPDRNYAVLSYNSADYYSESDDQQGVTVIVCARNELANLKELLPLLNNQDYPTFEILVMDDRSTDGTYAYLENDIPELSRVRAIRIDKEHQHVTPKKYALTIAIKKARYPTVLLTDADCRPASLNWLTEMTEPLIFGSKDITIGFSPYEYYPGLLNLLIRSETLFTAIQYFSLALSGRPYMGVGRNMAYRTDLFFANKGFYTHMNVVGGDDDLFINEVATRSNTFVCLAPDTFVWSKPKTTWAEWRQQKRRHLNVGKYYKTGNKVRLGLLTGSHVLSWAMALVVGLLVVVHALHWYSFSSDEWLLLLVSTGAFILRQLAFWVIVGRISHRLAHTVHWSFIPFMDLLMAVYYGLAGLKTLFNRRKKQIYWR
ncbi:glycosyltransferase [Spirosoma linguale]|uniref:Glycosyl transferase family 2 n=1 Tax=Spirosoma linguale (strain ATCC 33905 / DSM 74 / LMG 10896 / Claus 1) TaxID=504472 RepID=D2QJM1_SPILD|nr:glycosyl transferase family 2 [Spirosoma linguale DSM 74]